MTIPDGIDSPLSALSVLRERVAALRLPLEVTNSEQARQARKDVVAQLDDYVLPRTARIDAPLLAVVGGSTGAGKSTLVNALVGSEVSQPGVLRPTTRAPVLVYNPGEAGWFESDRILPHLKRVGDGAAGPGVLRLFPMDTVPPGLALLDAPDVDSVVGGNRELGAELLHAADLWLFMTTAARYADAVPWGFLHDAARRSAAVSVVLNRVPQEGADEVRQDLAALLDNHGLGESPMFVIGESLLDIGGMLPRAEVDSIASWLASLAGDPGSRAAVIYRTLDGAVADMLRRVPELAAAADAQASLADQLRATVLGAYDDALRMIDETTNGGKLLNGELLARWQAFIGTAELGYSLEGVGRTRDRVISLLRAKPPVANGVEEAVGQALETLLVSEADGASHLADSRWRADPAGRALLGKADLSRSRPELPEQVREQVHRWQVATANLINDELEDQRFDVQVPSFGVRGLAVSLMIVVLCGMDETDGADGQDGPDRIAGGTAVVGGKLLEAVFGDQAVRKLTEAARQDLSERARTLLNTEAARFTERLDVLAVDPGASIALRDAVHGVEHALREAEPEWRWEAGRLTQQAEHAAQREGSL